MGVKYATGEEPQPGDIIVRDKVGDQIRVRYIGVNGLGWEELDESAGGGALNASQWSLVKRDPEFARKLQWKEYGYDFIVNRVNRFPR